MNTRILIIPALFLALSSSAQEATTTPEPKVRKNEIGLMGETGYDNTDFNGPQGVQYKRWVKPNKAYRINIGYTKYEQFAIDHYFGIKGDTILEKQTRNQADMIYVGGGIETHRQFYKHVYLYAVIEAMAGYGSGTYEDWLSKRVVNNNVDFHDTRPLTTNNPMTVFTAGVTPYVGAKLLFNRISFGTEISLVNTTFTSIKKNTQTSGSVDMNVGLLRERFFILFRF